MLNFFKDAGVSLSLDADRLKVEGLKQLPPGKSDKIRQMIQNNREKIISELQVPAPSPPDLGPEYNRIWKEAWLLADFVDGDTAPLADRKARLAELDKLRARMAAIVRIAVPTAGLEPEPSSPGAWMPWESIDTTTRDRTPESCPARCRQTGKCYAGAYFKGKPGRAKDCEPEACKYISSERERHDSKTVGSI